MASTGLSLGVVVLGDMKNTRILQRPSPGMTTDMRCALSGRPGKLEISNSRSRYDDQEKQAQYGDGKYSNLLFGYHCILSVVIIVQSLA